MPTSSNGWPVLTPDQTRNWILPPKHGHLRLQDGCAGFVLAHMALWWAENIEPLAGAVLDDWGYAVRPVRGRLTGFSDHASGTAMDLNAQAHALGRRHSLTPVQTARLRQRLRDRYGNEIAWGGDYANRADEMHVFIDCDRPAARDLARRLAGTTRGHRLLRANQGCHLR